MIAYVNDFGNWWKEKKKHIYWTEITNIRINSLNIINWYQIKFTIFFLLFSYKFMKFKNSLQTN